MKSDPLSGNDIVSPSPTKNLAFANSSGSGKDRAQSRGTEKRNGVANPTTVNIGQYVEKGKEVNSKSALDQILQRGVRKSNFTPTAGGGMHGPGLHFELGVAVSPASSPPEYTLDTNVKNVDDRLGDMKWEMQCEEMNRDYQVKLEVLQKKVDKFKKRVKRLEAGSERLKTVSLFAL
jgi:hypothetical protein